jgi:DNA polymerase-3 subunit epsilon
VGVKVFLDTETTDLQPGQIAQLSYIITDDNLNILLARNRYFSVETISRKAAARNGLTRQDLALLSQGRVFGDYSAEIAHDLEGKKLVCHNARFDLRFLNAEFSRVPGGRHFRPGKPFCTMEFFTSRCKIPSRNQRTRYKFPRLEEVLTHVGISSAEVSSLARLLFGAEDVKAHDSRFDAVATYLICKHAILPDEIGRP